MGCFEKQHAVTPLSSSETPTLLTGAPQQEVEKDDKQEHHATTPHGVIPRINKYLEDWGRHILNN